jgi:hypothetical protein
MFGAWFEGYIVSKYGYVDVPGSGFKYIHCDLIDPIGYLTIILNVGSNFVCTFSPRLNVTSFIWVFNFGVTMRNRFERGDWEFVLRIGAIIIFK